MQSLHQAITIRLVQGECNRDELLGYLIAVLNHVKYTSSCNKLNFVDVKSFLRKPDTSTIYPNLSSLGVVLARRLQQYDPEKLYCHHRVLDHAVGVQCYGACTLKDSMILFSQSQLQLHTHNQKLLTEDRSSGNGEA